MPVTAVVPKALFPLVDSAGQAKCVLHVILQHLSDAGIREVVLVVSPGQSEMVGRYLDAARGVEALTVPPRVTFIEQTRPRGFGDAVCMARSVFSDEPFAVLLGDHVHIADPGRPCCLAQVLEAFERTGGVAMVGMQAVPAAELSRVGVAKGEPLGKGTFRCVDFVEKPDVETATRRLRTRGLDEGEFLGHCGIYVFTPAIFDCLDQVALQRASGEVELAAAQELLLRRHPGDYYLYRIQGKAYDMGTPQGYLRTLQAVAATRDQ